VADAIDRIVERAIEHTRTILATRRSEWGAARSGLLKIRASLVERAPGHPALDRLDAFIAERDRLRAER